jgi:hypothetical protein
LTEEATEKWNITRQTLNNWVNSNLITVEKYRGRNYYKPTSTFDPMTRRRISEEENEEDENMEDTENEQ